ncbi:DNA polymerase III subunit delta' [Sphingomonas sp. RB56-2]|uniref:DNA polymerase III subunit delta n=1 Tax=Sphingomonas brevis TaxID=2908206 RepID=A0ABT0S825_9SPHN|nr:DNA polymerase III subunit delta' [Sphingomonas brevis]MCL6740287.1 DNA polymerase III subunit delta' [Sphingomonas brevis]
MIVGQGVLLGQDRAVEAFASAWRSRRLHHGWLLTGPRGVGKASFARAAATRVLAEAAGPAFEQTGLETPDDHRIARLIAAGSHPDFRWLERLEKERGEGIARNISVKQVRELGEFLNLTPSLSQWRAIVIDSVDDLEASAANALLKMLEEPPANTLFFLVSHAPGRLLPTIRSRCRRLDFGKLDDDAMTSLLSLSLPGTNSSEIKRLAEFANGSIGRALGIAELDLAPLESEALAILRQGDPDNARRSKLASALGGKAAAERYAAFLELVPGLIAGEATGLAGDARGRALDAYAKARETALVAPRLSLDPAATIFQLGTILASVAPEPASR